MIKVVLCDDNELFRDMMAEAIELEQDMVLVGEATQGEECITLVEELAPDVLLLDIEMPILDGYATITKVLKEHQELSVVMLTAYDDDDLIVKFVQAGAKGYLVKDASVEQVIATVRAVTRGESILQPRIASKILSLMAEGHASEKRTPAQNKIVASLTEREREVASLLGQGASNSEISSTLTIGGSTVKTHVSRVFQKLGARDRVEAALIAQELGL